MKKQIFLAMKYIFQDKSLKDDSFIISKADLNGLIDKKNMEIFNRILIGKRLNDQIIDSIANGPTLEYFDNYNRINSELEEKTIEIQKKLQKLIVI